MNLESLNDTRLLERTENSVVIEFSVPQTSPYFDGHFPGFSLLPGVAQVGLIIHFASVYLATGTDITEMRRVKFTKFIRPNMPLLLRLEKKDETISFKMFSREEEDIYSSGTIVVSLHRERGA